MDVNTAFNSMITLLLAKFVLNDVPHAVGLLGNPSCMPEPTVTEIIIREGARKEAEWGKESYGEKKWAEGLWGRVTDGSVTLFHGTGEASVDDILRDGLQPSYAGWFYEQEEAEELPPEERPSPAVWLAYTPYLAFFFGDAVVQVTIPLSWIKEANDGVLVERAIPPAMVDRYLLIKNWE